VSEKNPGKPRKPARRRPSRHLQAVPSEQTDDSPYSQELMQGLRRALRTGRPVDLLVGVSQLVAATDPRSRNPFAPEDEPAVTLEELVDSFVGTDYAETTAALTVLQAFTGDDLLSARIGKVLKGRRQPMPAWLGHLDEVVVRRVVEMSHVLGDGDDYFLDASFPTGETLTALVYVDHNLGTVVKDAFVIPDGFEAVRRTFEDRMPDDTTLVEVDAATARVVVARAIDEGAAMFPPLETDTWPGCRALVEWLLRTLPEGGTPAKGPEWSEDELATLRDEFFASPYGKVLDGPDERDIFETFMWFASDSGPGDPLRWSPVSVEMLMVDWFPRKIGAETGFLAKVPDVLRKVIEYSHDRGGIRRALTAETLAAVDQWEPEYQRLIRSGRRPEEDLLSYPDLILENLARAVGGRSVLLDLDADPLPDEPFEWAVVPEDIHGRVLEVLALCDGCAAALFDVEHRTAFRRILGRAAAADPTIFRRKGSSDRAAAAVCWAVGRANDTVGARTARIETRQLLEWFGVKGSVSQRAEVFLRAIGANPAEGYPDVVLGSPDYLVSETRRDMIDERDRYLSLSEGGSAR
jgi:hypothetical protein